MIESVLEQIKALFAWNNKISRPWYIPLSAALAVSIPALVGAATGHFGFALLASLGGMVVLYTPVTRTAHRMVTLVLCSFGFMLGYSLGAISTYYPYLSALALFVVTFLAILITRYYKLPPPGSFFFILITSVSIAMPFDLSILPSHIGMVALGGMLACAISFVTSLLTGANYLPRTPIETDPRVNAIILEAALVGVFVGGSYALAVALRLNNPYWVPISCAAILQGATFRVVWHRNVHRIVGTVIGMGLVWLIFSFQPDYWALAFLLFVLQMAVELLITKNYALAVIFITPLTVIMAETASSGAEANLLVHYRLLDILIGSAIGCVGGAIFHRTSLLRRIESRMNERSSLSGSQH